MPISAAQYLRMSTAEQEYSVEAQKAAIAEFAVQRGYEIVRTYADYGKSGVVLSVRPALRELLHDVISHSCNFRAILVYDISRWGRFQDCDEAAHYEFICKSSGVSVHYCAEPFENNDTQESTLLKAAKRSMAAEFSRVLGNRVYERKKALVLRGFRVGGCTPYGLRRVIESPTGKRQVLEFGMHKGRSSDRVLIIPGPPEEVRVVQKMFRMVEGGKFGCSDIARQLNRQGTLYRNHSWNPTIVHNLITNPIYTGANVWGRTAQKLHSGAIHLSQETWITKHAAFEPIVSKGVFERAQAALAKRRKAREWPEDKILQTIGRVLKRRGKLSEPYLERCRGMPSSRTVRAHFGSYRHLYELLHFTLPQRFHHAVDNIRRTRLLHALVMEQIEYQNSPDVTRIRSRSRRDLLSVAGIKVSVYICPSVGYGLPDRWKLIPNAAERDNISLLCLVDQARTRIQRLMLMPSICTHRGALHIKANSPYLENGLVLEDFSFFPQAVQLLVRQKAARCGSVCEGRGRLFPPKRTTGCLTLFSCPHVPRPVVGPSEVQRKICATSSRESTYEMGVELMPSEDVDDESSD